MSESVATGLAFAVVILVIIAVWFMARNLFRPRRGSLAERVDKVKYWERYLKGWMKTLDDDLVMFWRGTWHDQAEKDVAVERTQHALTEQMSAADHFEQAIKALPPNSEPKEWHSITEFAAAQAHAVQEAYFTAYLHALGASEEDSGITDRESMRELYEQQLVDRSDQIQQLVLEAFDRQKPETYLPNLAIAVNADLHEAWSKNVERIVREAVELAPVESK